MTKCRGRSHLTAAGSLAASVRPAIDVNGRAVCGAAHPGSNGITQPDYFPHHQPFQYYASTANPHHLPPASVDAIGRTDRASHQYDFDLDFGPRRNRATCRP